MEYVTVATSCSPNGAAPGLPGHAAAYNAAMVEIMVADEASVERLVAVHNAVLPDDAVGTEELIDWRRQAEDMVWLVAVDQGRDVGAGVGVVGWHSEPGTARVEAWTLPDARGQGVGSAVLGELLTWCAGHGCVAVETSVSEVDDASLGWAGRRGFVEVGRNSRLVLDLDTIQAPAVEPPDGIEIVSWAERPGIERGMYEVYVEAEPDVPGEEDVEVAPFEQWLANDMRGASDRPDATFVALAGLEVVGFAKLSLLARGTEQAYHDLTGVRRAWRGRGIAAALKRAQIGWAKEHGYRRLVTSNEERNEPIRRLNTRHGYRVEPGHVRLRATIEAAGSRHR
jgi:GNAT superfamily N-acetyltransferase